MSAQTLLNSLFQYKASVDDELLDALNALEADAPSDAFRSALRVLNHAHLVDRIFVANLQGLGHTYAASWSSETPPLAQLSADIRDTDRWYIDYTSRISLQEMEGVVDFTFTDGGRGRMSREEMLAHVVTHGGYHRGEVGRLLPDIESTAMRDVFTSYLHRTDPARRQ
ncbi:DinB family protein [Rhizobium sp. BK008]|uniref:DinB family protein n=1 Tax=Rhizobium sp. BK008 TaxID=2587094 RepID=UPI0016105FB7|nr:DinB family protein [Rhizobium sp. BK008]MBB4250194.1 putative damage-inducible protein DinB [Rhizobium sp. BK008]